MSVYECCRAASWDVPPQGPLLELGPRLASYVRAGGVILLSGILVEQWPAVKDIYEPFFADFEVASEGKWALVTGTRIRDSKS